MKLIDSFRDKEKVDILLKQIDKLNIKDKEYRFMEVCGTHTMSISRFGLRTLLPENILLISGPGCPVCVTSQGEIDAIFDLVKNNDVIIATYGDLLKVPGSNGENLYILRSMGFDIRVVFSPLDVIEIAKNTDKEVVFLSIGFETTTPPSAGLVKQLVKENIKNVSLFVMNKTMPKVLDFIANQENVMVDGFLCPGHVSAITGERLYEPLVRSGFACVISGFEPVDVLMSVKLLMEQVNKGEFWVENNYGRVVKRNGNELAMKLMYEVFEDSDAYWRGIGVIEGSGLMLRANYKDFDAMEKFNIEVDYSKSLPGCRCGDVLLGRIKPTDCSLFGNRCTPEDPYGPCMVSSEGSCAAYYKYGG
ncbi:hydrogenase formation protein HypD [Deferribacter autotrophicus]|uniref:Hydrogenase formation protein HypD n=1 Tax=Deferribacter autotrophicus TaxID=500465 RepID=A0A5A8F4C7_9BACT|nr:hydrogenase formation protein HypD [Deferribacter autotrophicus]KAA0258431.1 hydrogenase formation protein HypD [Deferribacter autotrophicus]